MPKVRTLLFSYVVDEKERKINAINYFRDGIEPTWEDVNNSKGARLIFQIDSAELKHK